MKQYTIYECEITGKKFQDKQSCAKHEAKARRDTINEDIYRARKHQVEQSFADNLKSADSEFLKKYIEEWNQRNNNVNLEITMINLRYEKQASNSHSAPQNGETNWGGKKKDVPRGYPGLVGRIEGHFVEPLRRFKRWNNKSEFLHSFSELCDSTHGFSGSDDIFQMKGVHSGTGGGGPVRFGYSVTLFIDDFPLLKRHFLKQELKR